VSFKIVILSANARNLVRCVRAAISRDPHIQPQDVIVVDDGARPEADPIVPGLRWLEGIKPFVFARNVNLAVAAARSDVILLNDDALLQTPFGFTYLAGQVQSRPSIGLCSAGILGEIGNPNQISRDGAELRKEERTLAFVCVYLPLRTFETIGPLDERFVGYGFEDNDYCLRVRRAGLELAIWDGCVLEHSVELRSTFRTRSDFEHLYSQNLQLYLAKWGSLDA
jgi:GT2 family glycosyltransferase